MKYGQEYKDADSRIVAFKNFMQHNIDIHIKNYTKDKYERLDELCDGARLAFDWLETSSKIKEW